MSDSELRTFFKQSRGSEFGHMPVLSYKDAYGDALKFMTGLRSAVDHVELAYWPEIANTPNKEDVQKFELSAPRLLGSVQTREGQKIFMAELERVKAKMDAEKAATVKPEQSAPGA
jgi:hypothetical protein